MAKNFFLITSSFIVVAALSGIDGYAQSPDSKSIWSIRQFGDTSFRGVHISDDGKEIWASGTGGTILLSRDEGLSWKDVSPAGAEMHDFRDIHGLGNGRAVAMAIASPGRIFFTGDAGETWMKVYENKHPDIFLDAVAFMNDQIGMAFGDPIDGRVTILRTIDGGQTWGRPKQQHQPKALSGEGGFAASGTCICFVEQRVLIGLGGEREEGADSLARLLVSDDQGLTWQAVTTPLHSGKASGIFSIAFADAQHGVMTGGTYDQPGDTSGHIGITADGGNSWTRPTLGPRGYRSCVFYQPGIQDERPGRFIAIGKTGSDYSTDMGNTWHALDNTGFYAATSSPDGSVVVAVGSDGRIGVLWTADKR